jgi:hypothetical protein
MSDGATGAAFAPSELPLSGVNRGSIAPTERPGTKGFEAVIARNLAYGLVVLLAASIVGQYCVIGFLFARGLRDALPNFEHLFNIWLPVISGLASSAITFYLTKEKK